MNMRTLSSFLVIHRDRETERLALARRNVIRTRRASEANAMPNEQNNFPRKRRRYSVGSATARSSQQNPILIAPNMPLVPIVPFDNEFVQRLNQIADIGESFMNQKIKMANFRFTSLQNECNKSKFIFISSNYGRN